MNYKAAALALIPAGMLLAQPLVFDAVSVKHGTPYISDTKRVVGGTGSGGPGTNDPGRIHLLMGLKHLLLFAFSLGGQDYRVDGPYWLDSDDEWFEIAATMSPSTSMDQLRVMVRNLLSERFQLVIHHETRDGPVYSLVVAKGGPKMAPSVESASDSQGFEAQEIQRADIGADGYPVVHFPPGVSTTFDLIQQFRGRLYGQQLTTEKIANELQRLVTRPVTDASGLTGKYDFTLTFATAGTSWAPAWTVAAPPASAGADFPPDIFVAVQDQLGLRLEAKKGPVDIFVIDHIEKDPGGN